jgi:hypothetical protein
VFLSFERVRCTRVEKVVEGDEAKGDDARIRISVL